MKILFLCGSLEPGRDGVGDYTRRLAGELIRQGHDAGIIALNDLHIADVFNGEHKSGGTPVKVIRLPSKWPANKRFQHAGLWIDDFNPAWISLQFVPFSFHPRGLAFGMGRLFTTIGKGRHWHIMVHELWVGMDKEAPAKIVCWGWLQRQLIKSLFAKLNPGVIHTQTNLYMKMLEKIGFKPQYLPLFGNISVTSNADKNNGRHNNNNDNSKPISFVLFGGNYPGAPIDLLAKELKNYSNNSGVKVVLKMIGRSGSEQLRWKEKWKEAGLRVELLGEQSEERISEEFNNSTFGISTTPISLIEKSGSVAAMREHGLTVLCISRSWNPRGIKQLKYPAGIVPYNQGEIHDFISASNNSYPENNISTVTKQFVNSLLSAIKK